MSETNTVLVVGATGDLGGRVVDALLERGKRVRALVREGTDPSRLAAKGVEIARGDMLEPASLERAMSGSNAVVTPQRDTRAAERATRWKKWTTSGIGTS